MSDEIENTRLPTLEEVGLVTGIPQEVKRGRGRPRKKVALHSKEFFENFGRSRNPGVPEPVGAGRNSEEPNQAGVGQGGRKAGEEAEGGRICPACGQISDFKWRRDAFAEFGRIGREAAVNSRTNRQAAYEKYNEEILTHQELLVRGGVFASAKDVVEALRKISDVSGNAKSTPQDVGRDLDRVGDWLNDDDGVTVPEEAAEPEVEEAI